MRRGFFFSRGGNKMKHGGDSRKIETRADIADDQAL